MTTHHYDRKYRQRKCLDCPSMIDANGGKKRCATCAVAHTKNIQRQADARRRAKKRLQETLP